MTSQTTSSDRYVNGLKRVFDWDDLKVNLEFGQRRCEGNKGGEFQVWIGVKSMESAAHSPLEAGNSGLSKEDLGSSETSRLLGLSDTDWRAMREKDWKKNNKTGSMKDTYEAMVLNGFKVVFAYSTVHTRENLLRWLRQPEVRTRIEAEMQAGREEYDAPQSHSVGYHLSLPPQSKISRDSCTETANSAQVSGVTGSSRTFQTEGSSMSNDLSSMLCERPEQGTAKRSESIHSNATATSSESDRSGRGGIVGT